MSREEKKELRRRVLALRRSLSAGAAEERSRRVVDRVLRSGLLGRGEVVALYAAADGEVQTRPLFERLRAEGRRVVFPRVRGKGPEVDFFAVRDWGELETSFRGIPEPQPEGPPVPPDEFDVAIIPGVAFDKGGGRLGYGMGCYDRVLRAMRPEVPRAGIGYDFQLVPRVPMEEHDVPLTMIVVEDRIILPGPPGDIR